jgi:hypothetical protein
LFFYTNHPTLPLPRIDNANALQLCITEDYAGIVAKRTSAKYNLFEHSATVTASGSLYQTAFGRTSMIQEQEAHFPSPSFKPVIMAPGELEQARWVNDFSPYLSLTTVTSST